MKKDNLSAKGLSLSQAQSYSNTINQICTEIKNEINSINNFSSTVEVDGKNISLIKGVSMPANILDKLKKLGKYHATQAFLMENIKAKKNRIDDQKNLEFDFKEIFDEKIELQQHVDESWAWQELPIADTNEFIDAESMASHLGQFIHAKGKLDVLRKELPNIPGVNWMEIKKDQKTPITNTIHHESQKLLVLYEEIAKEHRGFEQRVNYFKAKIQNLVTSKNAEIFQFNADAWTTYNKLNNEFEGRKSVASNEFEKQRQLKIKEIASLRIEVDPRFQEVIDVIKGDTTEETEV